jgi:hypothetical protein
MADEKEYAFTIMRGIEDQRVLRVKESELTTQQKDLLLGEVVYLYKNLPDELKNKFNKLL